MTSSFEKDNRGSYDRVAQVDEETAIAEDGTILVTATPVDVENNDREDAVVVDAGYQHQHQQPPATTAVSAVPMIEIIAPATLMEGYQLDTQVGDQIMTVTIPPGGVAKGQRFQVPLSNSSGSGSCQQQQPSAIAVAHAPVGHWKDGLFDCCRFGVCHASCCIGWCAPALAAGQVIHRLGNLNWVAETTESQAERAQAFRTLQTITFVYLVLWLILGIPFVRQIYLLFSFFVVMNLRSYMRQKYAIPEQGNCPAGTEDCCVSLFCLCCSVSQMMRHTANYETYAAKCCTENGLPHGVSAVTV